MREVEIIAEELKSRATILENFKRYNAAIDAVKELSGCDEHTAITFVDRFWDYSGVSGSEMTDFCTSVVERLHEEGLELDNEI